MKDRPKQGDIGWHEIERLLDAGVQPRDVALELNCSVANVYARMKRRGYEPKPREDDDA